VTAETTDAAHKTYTLLERRTLQKGGYLRIENRLYQSSDRQSIGGRVPLSSLDRYAQLVDEMTLPEPLGNLGMVCIRTPCTNCVDGSDDGVAVYAAAAQLIHQINRNEMQINREFANGESRIIASADMFRRDQRTGRIRLEDHVFTALDGAGPEETGITIFSPAFRETSFLNRKQEYLRNVESLIGLKRGILSQVEAVERTAKEITSSEGDYNLTIIDFQRMWETALRELLITCERLGAMYHFPEVTKMDWNKDFSIDWGDGVLYNRDKVWTEMAQMVQSGMLKPEIAVAWYYDIPWETDADLEAIKERYLPEMTGLLGGV
jgi:A118 family predicted phage portal protein